MRARLALLITLALLVGCRERPYPGWTLIDPDQVPRPPCELRGGFAVRDQDGALQITRDPAGLVVAAIGFDAAMPYHDGWLLTRFGCEGELCRGPAMHLVHADGRVDELKLKRGYDAAASTPDGLYLLDKSCTFHRSYFAETSLYLATDLEHEPVQVGGPWSNLCARAMAVDDSGTIWLLGSVYTLGEAQLDDVLLRVENGQPVFVHQVRHIEPPDGGVPQTYTQLTFVDGDLYLSNPSIPRSLLRLRPAEHGLIEQRVVPSNCRAKRVRPRPTEPGLLGAEAFYRLGSAGVDTRRDDSLYLMPYHQPLDVVVDLLIELVPADGTYTIVVTSKVEPSLEPLGRLPAGFVIEDAWSDETTTELRRRFPQLDPTNR